MPEENLLVNGLRRVLWVFLLGSSGLLFLPGRVRAQATGMDPQRVYARARSVDPNVALAQAKLTEMRARYGEAQASRRPQLSLNGSASALHGNLPPPQGTESFYTLQGGLGLTIPFPGKANATVGGARTQVRVAEYQLRASLSDLAFRSNDAFYSVLKADDAVTIAQQNVDQANRQVNDTQKRIDAGDVPQSDLLKVQVTQQQALAALARAQSAAVTARQTLNALIGAGLDQPISLGTAPAIPILSITEDQAVAQAMANSPDVLVAKANVENAEYAVAIARHALDPTVSLQATQTHTTDPTTYTNLGSLGLSLSIPLIDGGVARQQVKEAQAQLAQARQTLAQTEVQTRLAAASAFVAVQSAQSDLAASQQVLAIAQESAAKAQQAYEAGLTTTRDVLDALLSLAQARSDVNNARFTLATATAKLRQVMGETFE